jgi:hypothetical protein
LGGAEEGVVAAVAVEDDFEDGLGWAVGVGFGGDGDHEGGIEGLVGGVDSNDALFAEEGIEVVDEDFEGLLLGGPGFGPGWVVGAPPGGAGGRGGGEGLGEAEHAVEELDEDEAVGVGELVVFGLDGGELAGGLAEGFEGTFEAGEGIAPLADGFGGTSVGFAGLGVGGGKLGLERGEVRGVVEVGGAGFLGEVGDGIEGFEPGLEIVAQGVFPVLEFVAVGVGVGVGAGVGCVIVLVLVPVLVRGSTRRVGLGEVGLGCG